MFIQLKTRSLTTLRWPILWLSVLIAIPATAQKGAPLATSSTSLPDFLSRARNAVRLEAGDSVMLHALSLQGKAQDKRIGPTKCGTGVLGEAHELAHTNKDTWLARIQAAPPTFSTKILSPKGRFTIHYTVGAQGGTTHEYAEAIGQFAEEAFDFEIGQLGYIKPPFSDADSTYHVYLVQLGNAYGYTQEVDGGDLPQSPAGLHRARCYMVIDNDFLDSAFVTRGSEAARITVFHEFHHVVQFGSYGRNVSDSYFQEMTSTWMEMLSAPKVEDYIQYLPAYISNLTLSFNKAIGGGYGQAIWLEYLASRFDRVIVRNIWEDYRDVAGEPVLAFSHELIDKGTVFSCEYAKFGQELFFTGTRTRVRTPFANATHFPIKDLKVFRVALGESYGDIAVPLSLHLVSTGFGADSVVLAMARDTSKAIAEIVTAIITGPSAYSVVYSDPARFCDVLGQPERTNAEVFPQPFILDTRVSDDSRTPLNILVATARLPVTTRLSIHSISMEQITTLSSPAEARAGGFYMNWNGMDAAGKPVPSGVYLYTADADGEERTGKIVVVRR